MAPDGILGPDELRAIANARRQLGVGAARALVAAWRLRAGDLRGDAAAWRRQGDPEHAGDLEAAADEYAVAASLLEESLR